MKEFFKLFLVDGHQVLAERNSNDEDREHIVFTTHVNDIRCTLTIGGIEDADKMDKKFNELNQEFVEGLAKGLIESALQA